MRVIQLQQVLENINRISCSFFVSKYTFYKTNRSFSTFTALRNHIRTYAIKNNLELLHVLKDNYDHFCSEEEKICVHCKSKCQYMGYKQGYKNPCFSVECYTNFVNSNRDYYSKQLELEYYDLYDDNTYYCSFSKRYFDITGSSILENNNFLVEKKCEVCENFMGNVSFFDRSFAVKTCSKKCKHKVIGDKKRKESIFTVETFDGTINELNHYIFENRKYPVPKDTSTNAELERKYKDICYLRIPLKSSRIHYSEKYDLYFFKHPANNSVNTLYEFLGSSDEEYLKYHTENSFGRHYCPGCNKNILFTDVFGTKIIDRKYCSSDCYFKSLVGKKHSDERKQMQSKIMKEKILSGEFTPNITNSWCRSKTRVVIYDEEKYVRSSWEAIFWAINQDLEYEKIRIPYVAETGNKRTYITDFYCEKTSTIYEIKPKGEQSSANNILKEKAALDYCNKNKMRYIIVDENYFLDRLKEVNLSELSNCVSEQCLERFLRGIGWTDFKLD